MTATLDGVTKKKTEDQTAEQQAAVELVRLAKERGLDLTGPDGLLKQLMKMVLESALDEEMTEHLGYGKRDPAGAGSSNIRNGTRGKTVLTDTSGPVGIEEVEVNRCFGRHPDAKNITSNPASVSSSEPGCSPESATRKAAKQTPKPAATTPGPARSQSIRPQTSRAGPLPPPR